MENVLFGVLPNVVISSCREKRGGGKMMFAWKYADVPW